MKRPPESVRGFTLAELAIVTIVVALLAGGLMMSLTAQRNVANVATTEKQMQSAMDALVGFAVANGRLPCPAAPNTTGTESPLGGGICSNAWDGLLPAITLGLTQSNESGYAVDAWGNPIRYAVTTTNSSAFTSNTSTNSIRINWNSLVPDLRICSTATGATGSGATANCASGKALTSNAVAVIYSTGPNGAAILISDDEKANDNADRLFVTHPPTPADAPGGEFDDLVVWLSPNILYNRLIAAGRLP